MTVPTNRQVDELLVEVRKELEKAVWAHNAMNSPHEGWAVIKEELDELWEHVRADTGTTSAARKEALQIAAMGLRYVLDVVGR